MAHAALVAGVLTLCACGSESTDEVQVAAEPSKKAKAAIPGQGDEQQVADNVSFEDTGPSISGPANGDGSKTEDMSGDGAVTDDGPNVTGAADPDFARDHGM